MRVWEYVVSLLKNDGSVSRVVNKHLNCSAEVGPAAVVSDN